MIILM